MDIEAKYHLAVEALRKIANFGHVENCISSAPVHECGCYPKDEKELAKDCLETLGEDG